MTRSTPTASLGIQILISSGAIIVTSLIAWLLAQAHIPNAGLVLIFLLCVLCLALLMRLAVALSSVFICAFIFNVMFTEPRFSLHMTALDDLTTFFVFILVGSITAIVAAALQKQRSQTAKAEIKASLLLSVSHDLRTPLAGIYGALSTLASYPDKLDQATKQDLLNGAMNGCRRLHHYVENLLHAVRLQQTELHHQFSVNDMNDIVHSAIARTDTTDRIDFVPTAELVLVHGQPLLLEQAIFNVIDNALRFSPHHEAIHIRIGVNSAQLTLAISDKGEGISVGLRDKIFADFFTTRPGAADSSGAGLGLSVSRAIVELHHGQISVAESAPEFVTTIELRLPVVTNPTAEPRYE